MIERGYSIVDDDRSDVFPAEEKHEKYEKILHEAIQLKQCLCTEIDPEVDKT
jgi:hypothetical protein